MRSITVIPGHRYLDGDGTEVEIRGPVKDYDPVSFPVFWSITGFWYRADGTRLTSTRDVYHVPSGRVADHLVRDLGPTP